MTGTKPRKTGSKPVETITFDKIDRQIRKFSSMIATHRSASYPRKSACWRRIKRMEEAGVIKKRVVLVDQGRAKDEL